MSEESIWECIRELQGFADDMHKEIDELKNEISEIKRKLHYGDRF